MGVWVLYVLHFMWASLSGGLAEKGGSCLQLNQDNQPINQISFIKDIKKLRGGTRLTQQPQPKPIT